MIFRDYDKKRNDYTSIWYSELDKNRGACIFNSLEEVNEVIDDLKLRYIWEDNTFKIIAFTTVE